MKSFSREFLRDGPAGAPCQIYLGAFGKHPGWDDHIDDIGLETESLVAAKQMLYVEGIGGQIGRWEQLDWTQQVAFDHVFVWRRESQILVGRMWTSSDGKKRTRYPMVVCAHCTGVPVAALLETLISCLEDLRQRALATASADEVRAIMSQFQDALREWLPAAGQTPVDPVFDIENFLAEIGYSPTDEGFLKMLWGVNASHFRAGRYKAKTGVAPEHFRLLAASGSPSNSLLFWDRVFSSQWEPSIPVLLMWPVGQYWLDAVAGEPAPADFFGLRASPRALPLAGDSAEDVPESFREEIYALLQHAATGEHTAARKSDGSWVGRLFGQ